MKRSLAVSLLLLCSIASAQESEDLARRRAAWFYSQRAYPLGYIPAGARLNAIEEMRRMTGAKAMSLRPLPAAAPQWTLIGPQPIFTFEHSGRVTSLAFDSRNSSVIYLGSAQGGVWKTINGGF